MTDLVDALMRFHGHATLVKAWERVQCLKGTTG